MQKVCVVCSSAFDAKNNQKTCSGNCGKELVRIRRRGKAVARLQTCVICGAEFMGSLNGLQITCGKVCQYKRARQRKGKPTLVTRPCVVCGLELVNPWGTTQTCEGDCRATRQKSYRRRYSRDPEGQKALYRKWASVPENAHRMREHRRRWAQKKKHDPEWIAKRRAQDARRRERKKSMGDLEKSRRQALSYHQRRLREMTPDELIAYRKHKAAMMRDWVRRNPEKYRANKRNGKHKKAMASALLAAQQLLSLNPKEES